MSRIRFPYKLGDNRARLGRNDWSELSSIVIGASMTSGQPGMNISRSSQRTDIHFAYPARAFWCFVRKINEESGEIIVSEARPTPSGTWRIWEGDVVATRPAPNYTIEHFEHFVIVGPQPVPEDRSVMFIGGYVVPDFRMLLVEPVDVEELCEPCVEDQA